MSSALFILLGDVSDSVLATPALEYLHQRHPPFRFDILARPDTVELFRHCPYRGMLLAVPSEAGWRGVLREFRELRKRRYSLVIDLSATRLSWLLHAKTRMARFSHRRAGPHRVEQHMAVVAPGVRRAEIPQPRVWLDPDSRDAAGDVLQALPDGPLLAVGFRDSGEGSAWWRGSGTELLHKLGDRFAGVVLLDRMCTAEHRAGQGTVVEAQSVCYCSDERLLVSAAVLERCMMFVGDDTPLGHLASAVDTPTLTLFGPGDPDFCRPWGPRATWMVAPGNDLRRLSAAAVAERLLAHAGRWQ